MPVRTSQPGFVLPKALTVLVERIMEVEVSARVGAWYGERNADRVTRRNGFRSGGRDTREGTMELQVPKLRELLFSQPLPEVRGHPLDVFLRICLEGVDVVDSLQKPQLRVGM